MNDIASSLQKAIQENYRKLGLYGMMNVPEVMCSCSILPPTQVSATTQRPQAAETVNIVAPQFVPGQVNVGALSTVDPGNAPFILPQGITAETIIEEQATALAPLVLAAEEEAAKIAAQKGVPVVSTATSAGGETAVAVATPEMPIATVVAGGAPTSVITPTSTTVVEGVPTTTVTTSPVEKFAPFRYADFDNYDRRTYGNRFADKSSSSSSCKDYAQGAMDMFNISLSSSLIYVCLMVFLMWYFVGSTIRV